MAKKKAEAHHGGAWKVAYADFVTAMMALFMVLFHSPPHPPLPVRRALLVVLLHFHQTQQSHDSIMHLISGEVRKHAAEAAGNPRRG